MEPSDFDKIIRDKLAQDNTAYADKMAEAKPYLWTAIQQDLNEEKSSTKWIFTAAAVILLLICSSSVLYFMQQQHSKELGNLAMQIDQLNQNYTKQFNQLAAKNEALACLDENKNQINNIEKDQIVTAKQPIPMQYVYVRDTIIINQVKYTTEVITVDSINSSLTKNDTLIDTEILKSNQQIYPTYKKGKPSKEEPDNIKVRINSFASNL